MKKVGAALIVLLLTLGLALPALANHPATSDSGVDIANTGNEMNQESFWESYFDGDGFSVECTKFENHNGSIPSTYEAAVVKSGSSLVRVYVDPPANVIGPANPNDKHPNRRFEPRFSWVMKCNFVDDPPEQETTTTTTTEQTTTTTVPEEPTTTTPEEDTTTTVVEETTTTAPPSTTTTIEDTTTTTVAETTTTDGDKCSQRGEDECFSPTTTTPAPTTEVAPTVTDQIEELPYTGMDGGDIALLGSLLLGVGLLALLAARGRSNPEQ